MTYAESLQAPCQTCQTAACCTYLPIHTFEVTNLAQLSFAQYLLNFEHFRLGLNSNGDWNAYYVYPCRHLDQATLRCRVHATPLQPRVCSHYNPYQCWYRPALSQSSTDSFILIDRARLDRFASIVTFDQFRNIVEVPPWSDLVAALHDAFDDSEPTYEAPIPDPAYDAWMAMRRDDAGPGVSHNGASHDGASHDGVSHDGVPPTATTTAFDAIGEPCTGCSAPCCDTVVFPQSLPSSPSTLDFWRFCLGFPGIELTMSETGFALVAKTRCRHLRDHRCSIYGHPDRPQFCTFYDAWKCTFRTQYGVARPSSVVRIRYEDFPALAASVDFCDDGTLARIATLDEVRSRLESRTASAGNGAS